MFFKEVNDLFRIALVCSVQRKSCWKVMPGCLHWLIVYVGPSKSYLLDSENIMAINEYFVGHCTNVLNRLHRKKYDPSHEFNEILYLVPKVTTVAVMSPYFFDR